MRNGLLQDIVKHYLSLLQKYFYINSDWFLDEKSNACISCTHHMCYIMCRYAIKSWEGCKTWARAWNMGLLEATFFCSIVRFCARLTRVNLFPAVSKNFDVVYMWWDVGQEFIYIWAGLYLVQLVYLGWNDNWLIRKLSCILMGWLYANGPNAT